MIHFFYEILHFKESSNLIGWQHFGPYLETQDFTRYGIGGEILMTILVFILEYFREKLMRKFFKKPSKPYFGLLPSKFDQKLIFLEKKTQSVFKDSSYLTS